MVKVENLEQKNMVKLIITVGADEFEKACEKAYQKKRNQIDVQGFRKGKAPRALIEKMYGPAVFFEEAANELIPDAYEKAAKESELKIVSRPAFDVVEIGKGKDFVFSAEVAVMPEIVLGEYKGVEVDAIEVKVSADDINTELKKVQEQNSRLISIEDRAVKDGDIAVIDFEGFVDGVAFAGGKGENHELTIGSHSFIDTFEDQIIGHKIGDEFDVNVTFPEVYQEASLAGKPAVFKTKVNAIKVKELPALDDEFAQEVSEFDTLDDYKKDIKKNLTEQKKQQAKNAKEDAVLEAVVANSQMDIPAPMIDSQVEQMYDDFAYRMQQQGLTMEMYLKFSNSTEEQMKEQMRPTAEKRIKSRLVLDAVAKAEGFTASDAELEEELQGMAKKYEMDLDKIKELISDAEKENMKGDICAAKAVDFITDNAVEKRAAKTTKKSAKKEEAAEEPAKED